MSVFAALDFPQENQTRPLAQYLNESLAQFPHEETPLIFSVNVKWRTEKKEKNEKNGKHISD